MFETYLSKMSKLCIEFTSLIAEAIGLPATAFDKFFDEDQQHKVKIVRYPDISELGVSENRREGGEGDGDGDGNREGNEEIRQGVGPHKDSMLTSYLLQASPHRGLQAQNLRGEWIDCSPIPGTLVVAIGQGLEAVTKGICASTTHRVLSPARGAGARYSIPFFQGVSYDATFDSVDVPEEVRKEKEKWLENIGGERKDDVEFTFVKGKWGHLGEATLYNRCKSHMDVAERWYPDIFKRILEERKGAAQSVGLGLAAESVSDGVPDSVKASEVAVVEAL